MNRAKTKNITEGKDKKKWFKPKVDNLSINETYSNPYDPGRENGHGNFSGTYGPS